VAPQVAHVALRGWPTWLGGAHGSQGVARVAPGGGLRGSRGGPRDFPKCSLMTWYFASGQAHSTSRQAGGHAIQLSGGPGGISACPPSRGRPPGTEQASFQVCPLAPSAFPAGTQAHVQRPRVWAAGGGGGSGPHAEHGFPVPMPRPHHRGLVGPWGLCGCKSEAGAAAGHGEESSSGQT